MAGDVPSVIAAARCIMARCRLLGLEGPGLLAVEHGQSRRWGLHLKEDAGHVVGVLIRVLGGIGLCLMVVGYPSSKPLSP